MSPKRHTTSVSSTAPARKHKGKVTSNALRQAVARRRLEERREAEMLRQHLFDVFADE